MVMSVPLLSTPDVLVSTVTESGSFLNAAAPGSKPTAVVLAAAAPRSTAVGAWCVWGAVTH